MSFQLSRFAMSTQRTSAATLLPLPIDNKNTPHTTMYPTHHVKRLSPWLTGRTTASLRLGDVGCIRNESMTARGREVQKRERVRGRGGRERLNERDTQAHRWADMQTDRDKCGPRGVSVDGSACLALGWNEGVRLRAAVFVTYERFHVSVSLSVAVPHVGGRDD